MGSMVSRCVLKRYEELIDAVILSGAPNYIPVAGAGRAVAKLISAFGEKKRSKLLHSMAEGGFIKSVENPETEVDWLSYDKDNVKKYIADPLCGFTFTARGYQDLMSLIVDMHAIDAKAKKKHLPILFVSGADDPCTGGTKGLQDSMDVLKQTGYEKITNLVYKNARHEILNEKIADKVIDDIVQWIEKAF
jgi:alpha-beta hydrolase superfamily lysophospholipase